MSGRQVESLKVAEAFADKIKRSAEAVLWSEGTFRPGEFAVNDLVKIAKTVDFAVIVLDKDDASISRGFEKLTPRDNVIFELGLFMGIISHERVFFLVPDDRSDLKLPSDLLGITPLEYDSRRSDGNMIAATGAAAREFVELLAKKGRIPNSSKVTNIQSSSENTISPALVTDLGNTEFAKKK